MEQVYLGSGCFGTVYKITTSPGKWYHNEHPNAVVKKVPSTRAEAQHEISVLKQCRHRFIVQYLDSYYESSNLCIVMEFCDAGTLQDNYHKMDSSEYHIWRLVWHLSSALLHLHDKSPPVVHRDIKPDNVLGKYYSNGSQYFIVWKIADFGIAKMLNRKRLEEYYERQATFAHQYMAPEIHNSRVDPDNRYGTPADIWSLGALLAYFCNRRHLFLSVYEVMRWTGERSPLQNSYSSGMHNLATRMLCPNPNMRCSARTVYNATMEGNRQRLDLPYYFSR